MKQYKYQLVMLLLVAMLAIGVASPALARGENSGSGSYQQQEDDEDDEHDDSEDDSDDGHEDEDRENEDHEDDEHEDENESDSDHQQRTRTRSRGSAPLAGLSEDKKAKYESKLADLKAKRLVKLDGKKLEVCEKREERINKLLDKSVEMSQKRLAVFSKIQDRVEEFYTSKSLSTDGYDAAVAAADEKRVAAEAAVEVMAAQEYSCDDESATNPGAVVSQIVHDRNDALKAYRSAVKDLIKVVKQALDSQDDDEAKPEDSSETEGENS